MSRPDTRVSRRLIAAVILLTALFAVSDRPRAGMAVGLYLGDVATLDADVRLRQPAGTDLLFEDVGWRSASFESPLYYGLRFNWWSERFPRWGLAVDFTHAKMFARLDETVPVSGSRDGSPVSGTELPGDTFEELSFSHGHNLLTVNAVHHWRPERRLRPYAGAGLGVALPHVEVSARQSVTDEFQLAGPAGQLFGGVDLSIGRRLSVFGEYKLTHARIDADLQGGGSLRVEPWAHHLVAGVSLRLGGR